MNANPEPDETPKPEREIALEEWIAAGQACCGIEGEDDASD